MQRTGTVEDLPAASRPVRSHSVLVDVGVDLADTPVARIAAEIFCPADGQPLAPLAFVCLPGGGVNRRFYDLGGEAQPSFSFARQMAAAGLITIAIDHLGVGESSRPADGFALTPEVIVAANARATRDIVSRLQAGVAIPGLRALPDLATIGVGHSMGGMLTVMQQAADPRHIGLVLLGYSNKGLVKHLAKAAQGLIDAPPLVSQTIGAVARQIYTDPYRRLPPAGQGNILFHGAAADRNGVRALKAARDVLLAVAGLQSMIPGSIAPQ